MTEAERAWIVVEWLKGRKQSDIASQIGTHTALTCIAIKRFCNDWLQTDVTVSQIWGADRKRAALKALETYFLATGEAPIMPGPTMVSLTAMEVQAQREHAFLLRAEGMTYLEIGSRLGVTGTHARYLVHTFGRRLAHAMRRTKVEVIE